MLLFLALEAVSGITRIAVLKIISLSITCNEFISYIFNILKNIYTYIYTYLLTIKMYFQIKEVDFK